LSDESRRGLPRILITRITAEEGNMLYEDLTYKIRGAIYEVYNIIGPGYKEDIYCRSLAKELMLQKLSYIEKKRVNIIYKGDKVGTYEPDFVIDEKVVVEIKSVPHMLKLFETQLYYYLKGTPYKLGLLVNFGGDKLEIFRRVYETARESAAIRGKSSAAIREKNGSKT
jgi:GxxExxY protein